jgi:hypothetical protein
MFVVYFYENKIQLLNQLRNHVPSVGENLTIKGRKGKITSVSPIDEKHIHVQVDLEKVNKSKLIAEDPKKKKR